MKSMRGGDVRLFIIDINERVMKCLLNRDCFMRAFVLVVNKEVIRIM